MIETKITKNETWIYYIDAWLEVWVSKYVTKHEHYNLVDSIVIPVRYDGKKKLYLKDKR